MYIIYNIYIYIIYNINIWLLALKTIKTDEQAEFEMNLEWSGLACYLKKFKRPSIIIVYCKPRETCLLETGMNANPRI